MNEPPRAIRRRNFGAIISHATSSPQVSLNGADYSSSKASFLYDDNWHEPRFSGAAPPALEGSAAAAVGKTIYYFGGADIAQMAEVGEPFISEMYALNTDTMQV